MHHASELFITRLEALIGFLQLLKLSCCTIGLGAQPGTFFLSLRALYAQLVYHVATVGQLSAQPFDVRLSRIAHATGFHHQVIGRALEDIGLATDLGA
jgi:hypothetical protein